MLPNTASTASQQIDSSWTSECAFARTQKLQTPQNTNCAIIQCSQCTEPAALPQMEQTPFSTPPEFIPAKTIEPQGTLLTQGGAAGCVRRPYRIRSSREISDGRTLQDVRVHHVRSGRRCVVCLSLPRVFGCHGRLANKADGELKSLTHSMSPFTPSPKQHLKDRYSSSAYFLPTTAFKRTRKVLPPRPHKLPCPTMPPRGRTLALRQNPACLFQ